MTAYVSFSSKITQATFENLISVLADQANNGEIVDERTKLEERQIGNIFREATSKDAVWAKNQELVHEIREADIRPGLSGDGRPPRIAARGARCPRSDQHREKIFRCHQSDDWGKWPTPAMLNGMWRQRPR